MKASYWKKGESFDYLNNTTNTIEANTVIALGKITGVAGDDILPGDKGAVIVSGVFEMPKTDATEIPIGTMVYFDGTGITATVDTNTPAGYVAETSVAGSVSILIKLLG